MQQSYDYFAQANIRLNLITSCKESVHIRLFLPYPTAHTSVVVNRKQIDLQVWFEDQNEQGSSYLWETDSKYVAASNRLPE